MHPYREPPPPSSPAVAPPPVLRVADLVRVRDDGRPEVAEFAGEIGRVEMVANDIHLVAFGERGSRLFFRRDLVKLAG